MDPQQLLKTSKFYSRCKKCDIEKTVGGPLGSLKVKSRFMQEFSRFSRILAGLSRLKYFATRK